MSDPILDIIDETKVVSESETVSVIINVLAIAEQGPRGLQGVSGPPGGGGSVTSNEFSALGARVDVVSNAVSALSNSLSANSALLSNTRSAVQANSANMVSADGDLSARIDTVSAFAASVVANSFLDTLKDVSVPAPSPGQALVFNGAEWIASTVAGGSGSVTSQELSVAVAAEASNRASADNALSVRIDTVSNGLSANSAVLSNTRSAVVANSAQMTSANNAISNAVSIVSAAVAVVSADLTSVKNVVSIHSQAISVLSQGLSVQAALLSNLISSTSSMSTKLSNELSVRAAADAALSTRIDGVAGGAGSVTSQEMSVAIAVEVSNRQSADNVLSQAISVISQNLSANSVVLSNTRSAVIANSAQMTSADNAISAAAAQAASVASAVSAYVNKAIGSEFAGGNISVGSVAIDFANGHRQAFSIQGSVAIAAPANVSTGASYILRFTQDATGNRQPTWASVFVWAGGAAPTLGSASVVDIVGLYAAADGNLYASYRTGATGGAGSVTSTELSNAVSALSNALSIEIANRVSADNAVSANALSMNNILSQAISVLSQQVSALSQNLSANSVVLSNVKSAVIANSAQMTSADNAISAAAANATSIANAASNAVSVETVNRASADNALSVRIDTVSNAASIISNALSANSVVLSNVKSAVQANSANMVSSDNALSVRIDAASQAASAVSAFAASVVANSFLDTLKDVSVPAPSSGNVLMWNGSEWIASAVAGGSGSVTSQELSVAVAVETSNRVSADNALSNAISAETANRQSAVNVVSNAASIISQALSAETAARVAAINTVSNAASIVSAYVNKAVGSEFDAGVASTASVVIDWSQGGAQKFSIVANTPFAAPTNMSAGRSYALRIVQDATGNRQPTWDSTFVWQGGLTPVLGSANAVDLLGFYADGTKLYGRHDSLSGNVSAEALARVSADNALSVRIDTASNAASIISQALSIQAALVSNHTSAIQANSAQMQSIQSSLSANLASVQSILSTTRSAMLANSADVTSLKNVVSIHSQAISVHSQQLSVISAGLGGLQMKVIANVQGLSGTALTNISGLSASVAAGGLYQIEGQIIFTMSVADTFGFGLTFPAMVPLKAAGKWQTNVSVGNTGASGFLSNIADQGYFGDTGSGSIGVSAIAGTAGVPYIAEITGLFAVSAAGTIQVQARVSATTQPMNVQTGFLRAYKIA